MSAENNSNNHKIGDDSNKDTTTTTTAIGTDLVVTKYKVAAEIVNKALKSVVEKSMDSSSSLMDDEDEDDEDDDNADGDDENNDGDDDRDNDDYDDDDDDDDDQDDEDINDLDNEDEDSIDADDLDDNDDSGSAEDNNHLKVSQRGRKLSYRRRGSMSSRRASECGCDHIATKIDSDGLPVTDVDLVTYKDLCHMEQAYHMRTTRPQRQPSTSGGGGGGYSLKPSSAADGSMMRRSSLQEESGAYYQLCTNQEEQNIRRKYVWFPPSLRRLELVDKFFVPFPKDKIPLVPTELAAAPNSSSGISSVSSSNLSSSENGNNPITNNRAKSTTSQENAEPPTVATSDTTSTIATNSGTVAPTSGSKHPAAGSYRDEQISIQLPRQDISLNYCSYQMDEAARLAYGQFVERRNSYALDVGTVVQVCVPIITSSSATTSTSSKAEAQGKEASSRANRLATFQRSGSQTPIERKPAAERQRKASTISQSAAMGALMAFSRQQQHQKHPTSQVNSSTSQGPQRCRRCLVRFEDQQLAVVAPNFIIGSALYPHHNNNRHNHQQPLSPPPIYATNRHHHHHHHQQQTTTNQSTDLASAATSAPSNAALFHPNCFTCSTCKEFLVDLVYCLRDNKLYCLRHYGESLRPRCSWCKEVSKFFDSFKEISATVCFDLMPPGGASGIYLKLSEM